MVTNAEYVSHIQFFKT